MIIERIHNPQVYCTKCKCFRLDDKEIPFCHHDNECHIDNCEDSMELCVRPCYTPVENCGIFFEACLMARLNEINNLAVGFYEFGPYENGEELDFCRKVERISDISELMWWKK